MAKMIIKMIVMILLAAILLNCDDDSNANDDDDNSDDDDGCDDDNNENEQEARRFFRQIISALDFCHRSNNLSILQNTNDITKKIVLDIFKKIQGGFFNWSSQFSVPK